MYVHFPSDVLAAAVLGVVIGELVFRYGNRLLDRHKLLTVNGTPPTVSPPPPPHQKSSAFAVCR